MADQSCAAFLSARWHAAAFSVFLDADRFRTLLAKAGFRPDQPRVPAGNPDGGQWTDDLHRNPEGDEDDILLFSVSHDRPPQIPRERPPTIRERNRWSVIVARTLFAGGILAGEVGEWVWEHAKDRIIAYQEPPKTLEELRRAVGEKRPGFDDHHMVEQSPARQDGFPESRINGPDNVVRIPTYRHWQITAWYATKNDQFGGLSPRDFLRGQPWEARIAVAKHALRLFGVLKP